MCFFKGDIKERTVRGDLQKMVDGGWLLKNGDGPIMSYSITNKKQTIMPNKHYDLFNDCRITAG